MYRFMFVYMRDEMSMDGLSLQVEFDRDIFGSFFLLKSLHAANRAHSIFNNGTSNEVMGGVPVSLSLGDPLQLGAVAEKPF